MGRERFCNWVVGNTLLYSCRVQELPFRTGYHVASNGQRDGILLVPKIDSGKEGERVSSAMLRG